MYKNVRLIRPLQKIASGGVTPIVDIHTYENDSTASINKQNLVHLEKPWLKYVPVAGAVVGTLAGRTLSKPINKMTGGLLGMAVGTAAGSHAETHIMDHDTETFRKQQAKKFTKRFKSAGMTDSEYIVDTPLNFIPSIGTKTPVGIRNTVEVEHPWVKTAPIVGGLIGGLISRKTKSLTPLAVGSGTGYLAKQVATDVYAKPYVKKYKTYLKRNE